MPVDSAQSDEYNGIQHDVCAVVCSWYNFLANPAIKVRDHIRLVPYLANFLLKYTKLSENFENLISLSRLVKNLLDFPNKKSNEIIVKSI